MKTLSDPAVKAEILTRLAGLRPASPRRWGKMSAPQMVNHLRDSFLCVTGEKPVSSATGLFQRTIVKWGALYLPMRWPHGVPTRPELDQVACGTSPAGFERDVAELLLLVDRVTRPELDFRWQPHPVFARMSDWEWMRWAFLHMDHHLRQFAL